MKKSVMVNNGPLRQTQRLVIKFHLSLLCMTVGFRIKLREVVETRPQEERKSIIKFTYTDLGT